MLVREFRFPAIAILYAICFGWRRVRLRQHRGDLRLRISVLLGGCIIDLLMGLFRGAVFRHGGGARKQPIKQPTGMPTSTMALMGRFPSLMGRFLTLMGRFADFVPGGRLTFENPMENSPFLRKGAN